MPSDNQLTVYSLIRVVIVNVYRGFLLVAVQYSLIYLLPDISVEHIFKLVNENLPIGRFFYFIFLV